MAVIVNIHEAKTHLSRLLERVAAGERVVIARAGTPVADLVPHRPKPLRLGGLCGQIAYPDDFDAPDPEIGEVVLRARACSLTAMSCSG